MSFIRRILRRPTRPIEPPEDPFSKFTDDWKPGDLGVCVQGGPWFVIPFGIPIKGPKTGELVRVVWAGFAGPFALLELRSYPGQRWQANAFRKVPPEELDAPRLKAEMPKAAPRPSAPRRIKAPEREDA